MMFDKMFLQEAENLQKELMKKRHSLHAHPETGFQLSKTKEFVKSELKAMGYTPIDCGKSGVTVTIGNPSKGKTFLIRGDMDALPIKEETALDFASSNGNMHACG